MLPMRLQRILSAEGIQFIVAAEIHRVRGRSGEEVAVSVRTASGERTIEGSDILVADGSQSEHRPGSVWTWPASSLTIAATFASTSGWRRARPAVWAIGECAGSPQFTHVSVDDFRIIRDNLAGGSRSTRDRLVPYCMFTDPPLARVGLSESEARRRGMAVRVAGCR